MKFGEIACFIKASLSILYVAYLRKVFQAQNPIIISSYKFDAPESENYFPFRLPVTVN